MAERPLYVELVEESFKPRRWTNRANAVVFLLSYVFVGALRTFDPRGFYFYVLIFVLALALTFEKVRGTKRSLLELKDLRLREIAPQIPTGVGLGLLVAGSIVALGGGSLTLRISDWVAVLAVMANYYFVVAPIESLLQSWVWVQTLPFGLLVGQVMFAAIHPEVLIGGSIGFFVYALLAGVFLATLTAARYFGPRRFRKYFGLTSTIAAHGTLDTVFAVVVVTVSGLVVGPLGR